MWRVSHQTAYNCMERHTGRVLPPTPESIEKTPVVHVLPALAPIPDLPKNFTKEEAVEIFRLRLARLAKEADDFLAETKSSGNLDQRSKALKSAFLYMELLGKHLGLFAPTTAVQVNVLQSDDWARAKSIIANALSPHPQAALDVAAALEASGL